VIIALDYGEKNIGVAVSDESETFSFPKCVIDGVLFEKKPRILEEKIRDFEKVREIVIGLPKNLKGENTIQTEKVISFFEKIKAIYSDKKVILFDEKFTSKIFEKELKILGEKMKNFKSSKDMYEASIILEDYLRGKKG